MCTSRPDLTARRERFTECINRRDSLRPISSYLIRNDLPAAKQERVRISERVQAGLARARKQGRIGGRPKAEDDHKLFRAVQRLRAAGKSIRQIAAEAGISTNTVLKLLRAAEADAA